MSDSNGASQKIQESPAVELTGRIMVVAMIVLFLVVAFVVFLHLYTKWYWRRVGQDGTITTRRRRRMDFAAGHSEEAAVTAMKHGLDPTFLKTIPILLFSSQEFKDGLECSVCLSEVSDGEKVRLLPKCNHGFHVECIDMWFSSHSTCPICRNHVFNSSPSTPEFTHNTPETEHSVSAVGVSGEGLSFPTNVLFWGNEVEVSTLASVLDDSVTSSEEVSSPSVVSSTSSSDNNIADEHLVIDIPRQINEEEDQKSPLATRLRSLKRLLSRDRKINPSNDDVEQAGRS